MAVSLASFRRYHAGSAWTWERMALTRARVVAGPPALSARVAAAIHAAMAAGPSERVRADAAAMRGRLARDLPQTGFWDVKLRPGGLMEVEFIAQALQLLHAREHPEATSPTTRIALHRLADAGLLDRADAALLIRADHFWRTLQGMLRITVGRVGGEELPGPSAEMLTRAAGVVDVTELGATMEALAHEVREVFERLVGRPEPAVLEGMRSE